jgi:hypothetical protein
MSLAVAAPPRLGLAQGSLPHPGVPLLYMSAGLQEVGLWDVLDGRCHQVRRFGDGVWCLCVMCAMRAVLQLYMSARLEWVTAPPYRVRLACTCLLYVVLMWLRSYVSMLAELAVCIETCRIPAGVLIHAVLVAKVNHRLLVCC